MSDLTITVVQEAARWLTRWFSKSVIEGIVRSPDGTPLQGVTVALGAEEDTTTHSGRFIIETAQTGRLAISLAWGTKTLEQADQLYIQKGQKLQIELGLPDGFANGGEPASSVGLPEKDAPAALIPAKAASLTDSLDGSSNFRQAPPPKVQPDAATPVRNAPRQDWTCPTCGYENFGSRTACRDCQTPVCGPPRPMTRSRDWSCTSCGYKNFGSRRACRDCQAPRSKSKRDFS